MAVDDAGSAKPPRAGTPWPPRVRCPARDRRGQRTIGYGLDAPEPASITVHLIRGSDVTDMVSVDTYRATIARLTGRNVTDAVLRRALDAHRSP